MAKLLYPMEARVAMINAHVDGTSEFSLAKVLNVPAGKKGPMILSEIPFVIQEEHLTRMRALSKTGAYVFILCSLCYSLMLLFIICLLCIHLLRTYKRFFPLFLR